MGFHGQQQPELSNTCPPPPTELFAARQVMAEIVGAAAVGPLVGWERQDWWAVGELETIRGLRVPASLQPYTCARCTKCYEPLSTRVAARDHVPTYAPRFSRVWYILAD